MEPSKMTKQMIDFQKSTFDNSFNAMVLMQDQTEKMVRSIFEQASWIPEDGRKVIENWISAYKSGRETFRKTVDDNYQKVEEFFKINEQ